MNIGEHRFLSGRCEVNEEGVLPDLCVQADAELQNGTYWGECRSVSCQFNLETGTSRENLRPLFDSSFFLGWLWSVPLFGYISDRWGRRSSLFGSLAVMITRPEFSPRWQRAGAGR